MIVCVCVYISIYILNVDGGISGHDVLLLVCLTMDGWAGGLAGRQSGGRDRTDLTTRSGSGEMFTQLNIKCKRIPFDKRQMFSKLIFEASE